MRYGLSVRLNPGYTDDLLSRQQRLQSESAVVLRDLDLHRLPAQNGYPVQTGSSGPGLMVWRDIDFNVLCDDLSADRTFELVHRRDTWPQPDSAGTILQE